MDIFGEIEETQLPQAATKINDKFQLINLLVNKH